MHLYGPRSEKDSEGGYGSGKPSLLACWPLAVRFLGALSCAAALVAAERTDISLNDGRVLKAARIISIGDSTVTVLHAGGVIGLPADLFPLDVLGRARVENEATAAAKKSKEAENAARFAERRAESDVKKQEELQIRLAEANARTRAQGGEQIRVSNRTAVDSEKRLLALKAKFPPKVTVKFRKKFDFEVPHRDVWSFYRGLFQTTTLAALPRTIELIERRLTEDVQKWQGVATSAAQVRGQNAESSQAAKTVEWLNGQLRRFIDEAKQLTTAK